MKDFEFKKVENVENVETLKIGFWGWILLTGAFALCIT